MARSRINTQVHSNISNRPANSFRGITVTEFGETGSNPTRFGTLRAVQLLNRPGLVAALTRKHNTRAGSSKIGTKENPFAMLNFVTELATDDLDARGSDKNWRAEYESRATGDTGRPARGNADRPTHSFVLILSCSRDRERSDGV